MFFIARSRPAKAYSYDEAVSTKGGADSVEANRIGDAVQRAEFWAFVSTSSPNWHTLIDSTPTVYPTQVIQVPQGQAVLLIGSVSHKVFGLMSDSWFSDRLNEAINSLHIAPTTLPVMLTYNTFLYVHNLNNCCVLGFHGAILFLNGNGNQQIQTFYLCGVAGPKHISSGMGGRRRCLFYGDSLGLR
jgi:hypothetical protein